MPDIDAASHARIHSLYRLQYIQRRMPQFILRPVIVDREAYVVLLHKLLNPRQRLGGGVARDNHLNPRPLAVFKLAANVRIFIFREIDCSGSVQLDARRGIVRQRSLFLLRVHRKMVLDILCIQRQHTELLQEADHLCPAEVTERIAGHAQPNRQPFVSRWPRCARCEEFVRSSQRRRSHCSRANEIAARKNGSYLDLIIKLLQAPLRHAAPSPSRTRAPTSSSLLDRPGSAHLSCLVAIPGSLPTRCWKAAAS